MTNYDNIEFALCDNMDGINPIILDNLAFYRVQVLIEKLNEKISKENDRTKKQNAEQESQTTDYKMPKAPKMPKMKLPKM